MWKTIHQYIHNFRLGTPLTVIESSWVCSNTSKVPYVQSTYINYQQIRAKFRRSTNILAPWRKPPPTLPNVYRTCTKTLQRMSLHWNLLTKMLSAPIQPLHPQLANKLKTGSRSWKLSTRFFRWKHPTTMIYLQRRSPMTLLKSTVFCNSKSHQNSAATSSSFVTWKQPPRSAISKHHSSHGCNPTTCGWIATSSKRQQFARPRLDGSWADTAKQPTATISSNYFWRQKWKKSSTMFLMKTV